MRILPSNPKEQSLGYYIFVIYSAVCRTPYFLTYVSSLLEKKIKNQNAAGQKV